MLALFLAASVRGALLMALLLGLRLALRRVVPARVFAAAWVVIAVVWLLPCAIPVDWSPFNLAPHRYLQTAVPTRNRVHRRGHNRDPQVGRRV